MASIATITGVTLGTRSTYDALGRVTRVERDSELGPQVTTTAYLPGGMTSVTDPKQQSTVTHYQFFDEPDYSRPVQMDRPEGVRVLIERDVFGKPLSVTQSGPSGD